MSYLWLILGLILILVGANALTDGASAIARRFGISDLVVGLTVVAFGTSAPELVISLISAVNGQSGLAIGNVIGSNIFNILAIIGITALIRPVKVEKSVMTREIPMVLISSLVLLILGNTAWLDGGLAEGSLISRASGLLLLIFFGIFMWYTFVSAKTASPDEPALQQAASKPEMPMVKALAYTVVGLAMLVWGGDRFVAGAEVIAKSFGVSDAIIGITIAAVGTSLPELATSIVAACKGKTGLAVGNVIGSNIFNIFLILGAAASVTPLSFTGITNVDLLVLFGASVLFLAFGWLFGNRTFTRTEGALMTVCYVGYVAALIVSM